MSLLLLLSVPLIFEDGKGSEFALTVAFLHLTMGDKDKDDASDDTTTLRCMSTMISLCL